MIEKIYTITFLVFDFVCCIASLVNKFFAPMKWSSQKLMKGSYGKALNGMEPEIIE